VTKSWKILEPKDYTSTHKEYNIDGKKYIRVTRSLSIIGKPGLMSWFASVGRKKADAIIENRQNLGTKVHKLIELKLKGKPLYLSKLSDNEFDAEVTLDMKLFAAFNKEAELQAEALEQHLWSNKYRYAGTADFIGRYLSPIRFLVRGHKPKFLKSTQVVGDWKTSRTIYPEYWLQLAAYCMAFKELTGIQLGGAFIVQFRFGRVKVKEKTWDELMVEFEAYKHALALYQWKFPNCLK
jgi:hypothetical protein